MVRLINVTGLAIRSLTILCQFILSDSINIVQFGSLDGYKVQAGSHAINAGVSITGNGGVDFWGTALSGTPDVRACEAP